MVFSEVREGWRKTKEERGKQEGGGERTLPSPKHLPSLIFRRGPGHQPSMTTLRSPFVAELFCLRLNFAASDINANNVRSCCPPRSTRVFQEYFLCNMLFWMFFVSSGFKFGSSLSRTSLANLGDQSPLFSIDRLSLQRRGQATPTGIPRFCVTPTLPRARFGVHRAKRHGEVDVPAGVGSCCPCRSARPQAPAPPRSFLIRPHSDT